MAGLTESGVAALELEKVSSKVPALFDRGDKFYSTIEKRDVEVISSRDMRLPLELRPGGYFGHFDPDGGSMGPGGAPVFDKAVTNAAHLKLGIQFTKKAEWSTNDGRKAVLNAFRHLMAKSMSEFRVQCEAACMTSGGGIVGTPSGVAGGGTGGGNIWTLNTPGDGFNARLIRFGQPLSVFATDGTTKRAEEAVVNFVDYPNKIIHTLAVGGTTVTSAAATDTLRLSGLAGGTAPTSIYGVPYHHSSASSGYWLGLNRATVPEIRANSVNAAGAFALPYARLAVNKVGDRLGEDAVGKMTAWMHPCQKQAYEELGQSISVINKTAKDEGLNQYFNDNMQMAGMPVMTSFRWDKTRIDFVNASVWGRSELKPAGLYDVEGRKLFEARDGDGAILTSQLFFIVASFNLFVNNPAACSYIYGLTVPSGY